MLILQYIFFCVFFTPNNPNSSPHTEVHSTTCAYSRRIFITLPIAATFLNNYFGGIFFPQYHVPLTYCIEISSTVMCTVHISFSSGKTRSLTNKFRVRLTCSSLTTFVMLEFYTNNKATLHVLTGAFMISFSAVWVKLTDVGPSTSGFYRVFIGFIFLLIMTAWKNEYKPTSIRTFLQILFCGFVFALDLLFWHESILYIGPGLATIFSNFQVFILATVGILFFKEKARLRFLLSIPIAVTGLFLVVGVNWNDLNPDYKTGIYLGLLTAVCYACFITSLGTIQRNKSKLPPFFTLMLVSLGSAIFLGTKMVAAGDSFAIPDTKNLLILTSLAFFSQAVGWLLIANTMPLIKASLTGFILLLQPTLSFVWDVLFFSRPTDMTNWVGVIITLSAIYMGTTGSSGSANKINQQPEIQQVKQ